MKTSQPNLKRNISGAVSAAELFGSGPSKPYLLGRRLRLKFIGDEMPQLEKIEFHASSFPKSEYLQRANDSDPTRSFRAARVTQVLPMFFLDYLCTRLQTPPESCQLEGGKGSGAATLGYALTKSNGCWRRLFTEFLPDNKTSNRVHILFGGANFHGKPAEQRIIFVNPDYLPPDCIEIYQYDRRLTDPEEIRNLADRHRQAWKLPPPARQNPPTAKGEKRPPVATPEPGTKLLDVPPGQPKPEAAPATQPQPKPEVLQKEISISAGGTGKAPEPKPATQTEAARFATPAPPPKIAPRLFQIHNPKKFEWDDFAPLINFGHPGSDADVWRIRDATEGVAIFGSVGSGKTSGSGALIAQAYLQAGFGGLVLTAKPDEARRWLRLCQRSGRAADCIHVTPDSGHKLNLLQYESQRPGKRISVTDDLIALLRCLIAAMSRGGQGKGFSNDEFWTNATNQLTRKLFDLFQLAEETLTIHGLVHFVNIAPTNAAKPWQTIPHFADLINRAEKNARKGSDVDKRIFSEVFDYWTSFYPHKVPAVTRGGFLTAFTAMADVLTGRGIYEIIGQGTNLTPEMILSGKIVILDFPMKQNVKGGFMVQAAFKLLFQQAVERRADKGLPSARPVFLWEDEAHLFFSSHDVDFQPTARDCRVSHVTLSQNLHNFMQHGHNEHDMFAVFAAMNTNIFHTNGDLETNRWASERIGMERTETLKGSGLKRPVSDDNISFFKRQRPEDFKNVGGVKWESDKQPAFPPEDFASLKRGGDGTCEAVILWLSHQFAANQSKNFRIQIFNQEQR